MKTFFALCTIFFAVAGHAAVPAAPELLIKHGHFKRARAIVEEQFLRNPNDPQAAYELSQIKQAFGDLEGALALAQKATTIGSRVSEYHVQLASVYGDMAEHAGVTKQFGLARQAKEELEKAVQLDPRNIDALKGLIEFLSRAPRLLGGDKDRARELAGQVARLNVSQGYLSQALIAQAEHDNAAKEEFQLKAIAADPRAYTARVRLATDYLKQNKLDLATKYAQQALSLDRDRIEAYAAMASILAAQQRWQPLEATLRSAEAHIPDNLLPYYDAAVRLADDHTDLARAALYIRKYLSQAPEGDEPTQAMAHWQLGRILEAQGRRSEAMPEIELAVKLDPNLKPAKDELKRLEK